MTKKGRQKLAQGQPLGISQYAFGDTGVDYTLYNSAHPSGSDSYGSAITDLPMLEAVPDDNVFLRYKLYGQGERNIQKFAYITVNGEEYGGAREASMAPRLMGSFGLHYSILDFYLLHKRNHHNQIPISKNIFL